MFNRYKNYMYSYIEFWHIYLISFLIIYCLCLVESCENCGPVPVWLLYLCIVFGILFLVMLIINLFLCTAMSCSCTKVNRFSLVKKAQHLNSILSIFPSLFLLFLSFYFARKPLAEWPIFSINFLVKIKDAFLLVTLTIIRQTS